MLTMEPLRTTVVFRKFKDGDVIALFPELTNNRTYRIKSYEHVGQHGEADYPEIIRCTSPAEPEEYYDLLTELKRYYNYIPTIRRKCKVRFY